MTTKVQIGTIIRATHRPQDLIPAFLGTLKRCLAIDHTADQHGRLILDAPMTMAVGGIMARLDHSLGSSKWRDSNGLPYFESEHCQEDIEFLFDALNGYAPVGCYFGAHFGDGSDFGFWPCEDLDDALMDEDVLHVGPKDTKPDYIMETNDHGNVTMYRVELVEEWSCV